jgi:hypothetical protein
VLSRPVRAGELAKRSVKLLRVERTAAVLIPLAEAFVQIIVDFLETQQVILIQIGPTQNVLGQLLPGND